MVIYTNLIALKTLLRKEIYRFLRIWTQTLLPPAITMSLYFIIFGKFIGSQLNAIHGFTYIQYIVPGLVIMSIITNAFSNTASSFFLTKFNRSIEEMLAAPMSAYTILVGYMVGGAIRGMLVGIIVFGIAFLFTHMPIVHPWIVLIMSFLAALVFSLAGLINGVYARRFDDIAFIPTFILTPLTYLGGVFYSIDQLPPIWRQISSFNPIFDLVNTFRYGLLGISDTSIYTGFVMIVGIFIVMCYWALHLIQTGAKIKS